MHIKEDIKLDYSDVLICPKRSTLGSRSAVELIRTYKFRHGKKYWSGVPIMAANMDGVGTFSMAKVLQKHGMMTVIRKHYTLNDWQKNANDLDWNYIVACTGSNAIFDNDATDYKLLHQVCERWPVRHICIDVANGYQENFVEFVEQVRNDFPEHTLIAGNVCTPEITEQLILSGADIVKVGIGPGCLAAGSRILMSNGLYKNIEDVQAGDRVIVQSGNAATVNRQFSTGYRQVTSVTNGSFHRPLILTPDHRCFLGDLSSTSKSTVQSRGYRKILEKPTRTGESKLRWMPIEDAEHTVALMPKTIEFELPDSFDVDISEHFTRNHEYKTCVESNYDFGYVLGFFLGDGNANVRTNHTVDGDSTSGQLRWYLNANDTVMIQKLVQAIGNVTGKEPVLETSGSVTHVVLYSKQWTEFFATFGKQEKKHIREEFMCLNKEYNTGLLDGLVDSDGFTSNDGRIGFTNTSESLIELFDVVCYLVHGSFPTSSSKGICHSALIPNTTKEAFVSRLNVSHEARLLDDYGVVKILNRTEHNIEVEVFDLEIDDPSHSFIANNMIVHNSVCTTRIVTGVGYPQLSAVIECADIAHQHKGMVIADGGCTVPGDVAKAFGGGADFVMLGGMLAFHDESEEVDESDGTVKFYGMSSNDAMGRHGARKDGYRTAEGKAVEMESRGPVNNTVEEILGGLKSTCTYVGAESLKELSKRTTFVRVNRTHNRVFGDG